jgi:hypothetical protein
MQVANWIRLIASSVAGRPLSPFAGLVEPVLRDISFGLLLGVAAIGIVRLAHGRRAFGIPVVIALAMWLAAAADLTLQPGHAGRLNLVPFAFGATATPFEPLSNILLFVPLGILTASLGWRLLAVVGIGLGVSLLIEVTQYQLNEGRAADVNDLLENALGALLGWLVALAVRRAALRRRPRP